MNKNNIYKLFYIIGILLMIAFGIIILIDYFDYREIKAFTSFPFYCTLITRALELLLPSVISIIIGSIIKHKKSGYRK